MKRKLFIIFFIIFSFIVFNVAYAEELDIGTAIEKNKYSSIRKKISNLTVNELSKILSEEKNARSPKFINEFFLRIVSYNENPEITQIAINNGANVNYKSNGDTPIMFAAGSNQNSKIIETLLNAGANINSIDKYGNTVLINASRFNKNLDVIKMLVEAGANINATGYDKRTALLGALERNPNLDIARYLIEAGADVKARDNRGNTTLLHLTSQMVDAPDIVKMLIDRGVDINAKNASCKTAYGLAGACGLENTRKLLVKAGHKDITVKTSCEKYSKFIPRRPCRIK